MLPLLWGAVFSGLLPLPPSALPALVWHGHEMFFGFGFAVLGGFLLTASKNWVGVRGIHGPALMLAAALWVVERGAVLVAGELPVPVRFLLLESTVLFVGGHVVWTLVKHRRTDSFQDNVFFLVALPALVVAKHLTLDVATFTSGFALTLGLFRVAFVVMLERTLPPFVKSGLGITLVRHRLLDTPIKLLTLLAAFGAFLPGWLAIAVLAAASALLLLRWLLWRPLAGLRRFEIGVMYVGYLGLATHLALEALRLSGLLPVVGAVSTHTFTFLCMGLVVPAMLVRICQGHTGRKLLFTLSDRVAISSIGVGACFRLGATQAWPAHYTLWIALAGLSWTICFTLLGLRLVPFLLQPRVDGKVH